jgi:hypothetical protein
MVGGRRRGHWNVMGDDGVMDELTFIGTAIG